MSEGSRSQYEFSEQQNVLIGSLSSKMGLVGFFFTVVGLFNILGAILLGVAIFRRTLPPEVIDKMTKDFPGQLPPNNLLWGWVMMAGLSGLIYLLIGVWTQTAAGSFRQIVDTRGHDVNHLMNALGSLHKMYGLLYTLLMIAILLFLVSLGVSIYHQWVA